MELEKSRPIIEAILFSCGRPVSIKELMSALELSMQDIELVIEDMRKEYQQHDKGIEIIKINDTYQMCTQKEYYEYIYPLLDNRVKPTLSQAAMETLSIIAYNPRVSRAEVEAIRGVNSDGTIYKLLEYNLIEEAGKSDAPGRPMTFRVTTDFLKMFGMTNIEELPELPKYKLDENEQIVLEGNPALGDTLPEGI